MTQKQYDKNGCEYRDHCVFIAFHGRESMYSVARPLAWPERYVILRYADGSAPIPTMQFDPDECVRRQAAHSAVDAIASFCTALHSGFATWRHARLEELRKAAEDAVKPWDVQLVTDYVEGGLMVELRRGAWVSRHVFDVREDAQIMAYSIIVDIETTATVDGLARWAR